jgi:GNAT superfamily N-acetyltransferase
MPVAVRHRRDDAPCLEPLSTLVVERVHDPAVMADLQGRAEAAITRRFEAGHRAYVARHEDRPAAWGWVATRAAEIGELGARFMVPSAERYLWNFVTLAAHRGRGIYPRLLDAIVRAESREAERFWIAYAPENHASGAGVLKAGFIPVAELSFDGAGHPALSTSHDAGSALARMLALPVSHDALTRCWRCTRAGRDRSCCTSGRCRCDYQRPESGCTP